jgi:hypothetical protein
MTRSWSFPVVYPNGLKMLEPTESSLFKMLIGKTIPAKIGGEKSDSLTPKDFVEKYSMVWERAT